MRKEIFCFPHCMEVTAPLHMIEKILGCICVMGYTSDERHLSVFWKDLEADIVSIWEWYGAGSSLSVMGHVSYEI